MNTPHISRSSSAVLHPLRLSPANTWANLCSLTMLLCALALSGCAAYQHKEKHELDYLQRALTQNKGNLQVSVVVLSAQESQELFGTALAVQGIQPVWVRIRNNDPVPYWLYAIALDPAYFSPHEAAWKNHFFLGGSENSAMDTHFRKQQIHRFVPPGQTISGFLFTRLDEGIKPVTIDLQSADGDAKTFFFSVPVPGLPVDSDQVDFDALYPEEAIVRIEDLAGLRAWIESLPCCVFGEDGTTPGDPLNLVMVGERGVVASAFIHQGWRPVEITYAGSIWKMVKSSLFGSRYRYSPMSPLYLFGRSQDFGLQKPRATVDERNHLRLWLAPARFKGMPILVGQISRDIGVRLTGKLWPPTTHVIDPEVDEARWYLAQDLATSQRVIQVGLAKGIGLSTEDKPQYNLLGDPYYTDGLRLVAIFTTEPTAYDEIDFLDWEEPRDIRFLRSGDD